MRIAPDKWKHFFVGLVMGIILQAFDWWVLADHHILAISISLFIVIAVSYGFELFSLFTGKGHYDFLDAVAAVIGGVLGIGAVLLIQVAV